VIQEAFLKIYRNLQAFDDTFSFSTWAYQITRNCAIDSLRKKRVRPQTVALTEEEWEQIRVIATEEHDQPFDLVLVKKASTPCFIVSPSRLLSNKNLRRWSTFSKA
jgi:RNA polymerase sigma factor (sigma-70 family)